VIRIKEHILDNDTIAVEVDGILDHGAVPVLKNVCDRHLDRHRKIMLNLAGIIHVTREGRTFLYGLQERIRITNLPEFMVLENEG